MLSVSLLVILAILLLHLCLLIEILYTAFDGGTPGVKLHHSTDTSDPQQNARYQQGKTQEAFWQGS